LTVAFRRYPVCLPLYLFVCLSWTENAYRNNIIMHTHTQPLEWTGGWRILGSGRRLLCLILFVVRAYFKGEREGGAVFVRSPSSIEYRYSPSPSPLSLLKNSVSDLFCFSRALRHHICPLISFASPRLSIRSLLRQRNLPPSRSPISKSYRIVLYYKT